LGPMGITDQVDPLVIEGGVEEEAVVIKLEVLVGLANSALAESYELLTFGQGANGDSPFFESNRHMKGGGLSGVKKPAERSEDHCLSGQRHSMHESAQKPNVPVNTHFLVIYSLSPASPSRASMTAAKSSSPWPRPAAAVSSSRA